MSATEAERVLLNEDDLQRTLRRIAHEIVERHPDISRSPSSASTPAASRSPSGCAA